VATTPPSSVTMIRARVVDAQRLGMPIHSVATALGVSVATTKRRRSRAWSRAVRRSLSPISDGIVASQPLLKGAATGGGSGTAGSASGGVSGGGTGGQCGNLRGRSGGIRGRLG
jgi:uncharacterized membrane protein